MNTICEKNRNATVGFLISVALVVSLGYIVYRGVVSFSTSVRGMMQSDSVSREYYK